MATSTTGWGATADPSKISSMMGDYLNGTSNGTPTQWGQLATGQSMDFAGGALTKNQDGSATYKNGNTNYTFNTSTPFETVAANAPQIGQAWNQNYGWNPGQSVNQASASVTAPTVGTGGSNVSAANWNVDNNQLVEGRLKGLLSQDNPLVQMAKTQGLENAQQRGLLNSSLGAEAGTLAHYQYAMPIAQADATMFGNAARTNAENQTQANLTGAQIAANKDIANANISADLQRAQMGYENAIQLAGINAQARMAELDKQNANAFAQLDKQQSYAIRNSYLSSMTSANSQMQSFINSVQAADMPDDAKTAQINAAQESFNNTIRYMDAAYSRMPSWSKEWSLLPATIG